ncbi:O-antigen ligase family protein [Kocuria flava]|uniref:O-antigen ligase family protein n=1 Tax=Kocuria flava TaxID=446860 RepID=UPI002F91DE09
MSFEQIGPIQVVALAFSIALVIYWIVLPRTLPITIAAFLLCFSFSPILPDAASLGIQGIALVLGFAYYFLSAPGDRRGGAVVPALGFVAIYWLLLILHPNVPSVLVGAQGYQKSILAISGLALGASVRAHYRASVEVAIIKILSVAVFVSIIAYFWIPEITSLVNRDADEYTASFRGIPRLQGIYPGPFHVALSGLILVSWSLHRWKTHRLLSKVAIIAGLAAMYLSYVRTVYVALAAIAIAMFILSASRPRKFFWLLLGSILTVPTYMFLRSGVTPVFDVLRSLAQFTTDERFLNRIPEYLEGFDLFSRSPFLGWGSGAAGDTLGDEFQSGEHISPHNVILKILVEGGIIGLVPWICLFVLVVKHLDRKSSAGKLSVSILVGIFSLGMTTASIEAVPPAYFAFVLVGLSLTNRQEFHSHKIKHEVLAAPG